MRWAWYRRKLVYMKNITKAMNKFSAKLFLKTAWKCKFKIKILSRWGISICPRTFGREEIILMS